jgi:O-antigen/teichoic acid export membrane protein
MVLAAAFIYQRTEKISAVTVVTLCALVFVDTGRSMEIEQLIIAGRQRASAILGVVESVAKPSSIVLIALLWGGSSEAVVVGALITALLPWLLTIFAMTRDGLKQASASCQNETATLRRSIVKFCLPLIPFAVAAWVINLSDRYIIQAWMSAEQVGIYAANYAIPAGMVQMAQQVVYRVFGPLYYTSVAKGDASRESRLIKVWLVATLFFAIGSFGFFVLVRPWISSILLAPKYRSGSYIMNWVAGGFVFWSITYPLEARLYAHRQTGRLLVTYIVAAIVAVAVPWLLVPRIGILGAAIACPIYYGVMVACQILVFKPSAKSKAVISVGPQVAEGTMIGTLSVPATILADGAPTSFSS